MASRNAIPLSTKFRFWSGWKKKDGCDWLAHDVKNFVARGFKKRLLERLYRVAIALTADVPWRDNQRAEDSRSESNRIS